MNIGRMVGWINESCWKNLFTWWFVHEWI